MARPGWLAAAAALLPHAAQAYSIQTAQGLGCHEIITGDALIAVRATTDAAAPVDTGDEDDAALIQDVPFTLPVELQDLVGATLLIGARDNDLQGRSPSDLSRLITLHGSDEDQDAHCLRSIDEDEPDGSLAAIDDCRAFIDDRLDAALDGLGKDGVPDVALRKTVPVYLQFRGIVDVSIPTFWYEMGRAMHTVEDSYTHTYRSDDYAITSVLNFVEMAEKDYAEDVDGPVHLTQMDVCTGDAYREDRAWTATTSVTDLLLAMLGAGSNDERRANADTVIDRVLTFEKGCDASNDWCSAHERSYATSCATTSSGGIAAALVALCAIALRRRPSRSILLGAVLFSGSAAAEPVTKQAAEKVEDTFERTGGLELRMSASIAREAFAPAIGWRYRFNEKWVVGGDAEWNPWYSTTPLEAEPGTVNVYGTIKREFPMKSQPVRITTTLNLGASVLLFNLYETPAGSVGPYFGLSLVGVEWKAFRHSYFLFDPGVAVPVPRITGIPFAYYQYRLTVGVRWGA
jgi:hypothetical protein